MMLLWLFSGSVMSDFLQPLGLLPTRFFCLWHFPAKNIGVGCPFFFQGIFPTQGSNPHLLPCRWILHPWDTWHWAGFPVLHCISLLVIHLKYSSDDTLSFLSSVFLYHCELLRVTQFSHSFSPFKLLKIHHRMAYCDSIWTSLGVNTSFMYPSSFSTPHLVLKFK